MKLFITLSILILSFSISKAQSKSFESSDFDASQPILIPDNLVKINSLRSTKVQRKNGKYFRPITHSFVTSTISQHDGLRVVSRNNNKTAIMIEGSPTSRGRSGSSVEDLAQDFLFSASPLMAIDDPDQEFGMLKHDIDDLNMHHIKYQQYYKGIEVYGSQVILHGLNGDIDLLMGRYVATPKIDVIPSIDDLALSSIIQKEIGETKLEQSDIFDIFDIKTIENNLVIYDNVLAYHITAYANLIDRYEIFVDATSGKIITKYKSICKLHNHSHNDNKIHKHSNGYRYLGFCVSHFKGNIQ